MGSKEKPIVGCPIGQGKNMYEMANKKKVAVKNTSEEDAALKLDAFLAKTDTSFAKTNGKKALAGVVSRTKDVAAVKKSIEDVRYFLLHGKRNPGPFAFDPSKPLVEMRRGEMIHLKRWAGREKELKARRLAKDEARKIKRAETAVDARTAVSNPYSDSASVSSIGSQSEASTGGTSVRKRNANRKAAKALFGDNDTASASGSSYATKGSTKGSTKRSGRTSKGRGDSVTSATLRSGSQVLRSLDDVSAVTTTGADRCPNQECFCNVFWGNERDDNDTFD